MVRLQMILAPSKTLNFDPCATAARAGRYVPVGMDRANDLVEVLKEQSHDDLAAIIGVKKASPIVEKTQGWYEEWDTAGSLQAIALFDGFAYDKLQGRTLSEAEMQISHRKLVIPTAVYGPVRGLDAIKQYRLEMANNKFLPEPYNKLANFWKELCTETIAEGYDKDCDDKVLVNIASEEFAKAVDLKQLKADGVKVVKCDFGPDHGSTTLKYCRGLMARYIIQNDCESIDDLKGFNLESYAFAPDRSNDDLLFFLKGQDDDEQPAKKKQKKR